MIVQTKTLSHRKALSVVPENSIPTRNCKCTISSVVAESPGDLARGQCARAATVPLGGAPRPSWRLGACGLLPPPPGPGPPPTECSWQWAAPGRADSGGAASGLGAQAAAQMPGRTHAGPGLPRGRAHARRATGIVMQTRAAVRMKLELGLGRGPGASPFEASRGRGPGSAQFARGCPGHCVLHGSSVSKSMKPRNEATAEYAQNVRSSFAAGPDVAAAS